MNIERQCTCERTSHSQVDRVPIDSSVVFDNQIIWARIMDICIDDPKSCHIAVLADVLCHVVDTVAFYIETFYRIIKLCFQKITMIL